MDDLTKSDALVIVDVQRDFMPGGALAIPDGDAIIGAVNDYAREFARASRPVFATRDWHPVNHCSFAELGGRWPEHCVAGTHGAEWAPGLELPPGTEVISKGKQAGSEGYSAFDGTHLCRRLRALGIRRLFLCGLATDYCVRATAMDALREGFEVVLLVDAMRAADVRPGDGIRALAQLEARGAKLRSFAQSAAA
jgi:nicotinamidase/pyrazinamidase